MLDHIGFAAADLEKSTAFYAAALQPLGLELLVELPAEQTGTAAHAGFGAGHKAFFRIGEGGSPRPGVHIAFTAQSRAQVVEFYRLALQAAGRDNGAPGFRPPPVLE